jgi:dTDP-4-dehydrorhamnose reductase
MNNGIDTVINCSGFTGKPNIDEAEHKKELCWKLNVESPLRINKICNDIGINYLHVSSGCIFDGYHKDWTEDDSPNYGMFSDKSSFYSKTKHAFELVSKDLKGVVLRVRMPFDSSSSRRNYLTKIRSYDNLINYRNSKTYIPDFCMFVEKLLEYKCGFWSGREIYNVVNPQPLDTKEICEIMKTYGHYNGHWNFVPIEDLKIVAGRSNCVLDTTKSGQIYKMKTEKEAIVESIEKLLNK